MESFLIKLYTELGVQGSVAFATVLLFNVLLLLLLKLERDDKNKTIKNYEDPEIGKFAEQRKAHKEELRKYELLLNIERNRANSAWKSRMNDVEKMADAMDKLNDSLILLTERLRD
jgi:hypothetical protein